MSKELLCYEQPVNEVIRTCLRLEQLFNHAAARISEVSSWDNRDAFNIIFEILSILDRPDLKNKLVKITHGYLLLLNRLSKAAQVDQQKLIDVTRAFQDILDRLHALKGKMGQSLRENELLSALRNRVALAGGACDIDTPGYVLWLHQNPTTRTESLRRWLHELTLAREAVTLILAFIRDSSLPFHVTANSGFLQRPLSTREPCQLVRIHLPETQLAYPEVSVGHHGVNIRFFEWHPHSLQSEPSSRDIPFILTICAL